MGKSLLLPLLKILLLTFILYLLLTGFFLNSFRIDSDSMRTTLQPGDRVLATKLTYNSRLPFAASRTRPPRRGEIVLLLSPFHTPSRFPLSVFEPLVRFVTLQRGSVSRDLTGRRVPKYLIKRVIAVPGDTLRLENYTAYIRPAEGTLDFALMFIPAENIYYETVVKYAGDATDIIQYSLEKKVIPVSPNLLYAYLMTVAMGLHGLQIEKQAAEIRQNLQKLNADLSAFVASWDILGGHLRNANTKYEDSRKQLDRFTLQLEQVAGTDGPAADDTP